MSANTMCGFLPPSSTATLVTCSAATLAMVRPVASPPVNEMKSTSAVVGQRGAEHRAAALHEVDHTAGHARLLEQVHEGDGATSGVTSLGLATIVQPAPSAGAIFHDICSSG